MRAITIASLGASALLGLGALVVAKVLLPAQGNVAQASAPAPAADLAAMVVAREDIAYGERLEARRLIVVRAPKDAVPAGAFTSVDQVLKQDNGQPPLALQPIAAREPLLPTKLSGPGARPTIAAEIAAGMRAYTIAVSDVSGVGGHALPGDHVDVVLMRDLAPDEDRRVLQSEIVLQNVRVLGMDLNADPTSSKPAAPSTATLEVTMKDAQKLALAADLGRLSLALRGAGQAEIEAHAPLGAGDVVTGGVRAAAGPARPRAAGPSSPPAGRLITIVEGEGV
ncbi:MAG: Flp pilus assembly protein CpaB [Phenylobacterium sp.]|uniref:Flp pilus assembly protein CpaB n=1 Tax=Phenylobacterium sp. TaxID=1871053 RepID=UPI00391DAFEC